MSENNLLEVLDYACKEMPEDSISQKDLQEFKKEAIEKIESGKITDIKFIMELYDNYFFDGDC